MPHLLARRLDCCFGLQSVLDCVLSRSLELTGAILGNLQLMDWNTGFLSIAAQRGLNDQFLNFFHRVKAEDGSACGRAIRERSSIVIEDVLFDAQFAFCRDIALEAGVRAVQSTPLISSSGAFLGVVSTHFPARHRPLDREMQALKVVGQLAANTLIRQRALASGSVMETADQQLIRAHEAIRSSRRLLRLVGERLGH